MQWLRVLILAAFLALSCAFLCDPASAQDVPASVPEITTPTAAQGKSTTYTITVLSNGKAARTITYRVDDPYPMPLEGPLETRRDKNGRRIVFQVADYYSLPFLMSSRSINREREMGKTNITLKENVRIEIKQSEHQVLSITGDEATIVVTRTNRLASGAIPGKQSQGTSR